MALGSAAVGSIECVNKGGNQHYQIKQNSPTQRFDAQLSCQTRALSLLHVRLMNRISVVKKKQKTLPRANSTPLLAICPHTNSPMQTPNPWASPCNTKTPPPPSCTLSMAGTFSQSIPTIDPLHVNGFLILRPLSP